MKILFDQGTPAPLKKFLNAHTVLTAAEAGWSDLGNGQLLSAAEEDEFDLLVTTDRNLACQQNLTTRKIGIVVILHSAWPILRQRATEVATKIDEIQPGDYIEI